MCYHVFGAMYHVCVRKVISVRRAFLPRNAKFHWRNGKGGSLPCKFGTPLREVSLREVRLFCSCQHPRLSFLKKGIFKEQSGPSRYGICKV